MDVIRCAACGAEVNALATGCPGVWRGPADGRDEVRAARRRLRRAASSRPSTPSLSASPWRAGFCRSARRWLDLSVVLSPAAIVVGIGGFVESRRAGRPAGRAVLAIVIAAAALVFALWVLGVWTIDY